MPGCIITGVHIDACLVPYLDGMVEDAVKEGGHSGAGAEAFLPSSLPGSHHRQIVSEMHCDVVFSDIGLKVFMYQSSYKLLPFTWPPGHLEGVHHH